MTRTVIALDFDLCLNHVSFPADVKATSSKYEKVLKEQGIEHEKARTYFYYVWRVLLFVILSIMQFETGATMLGVGFVLSHDYANKRDTEERRYHKKIRHFLKLAHDTSTTVIIVTRNTEHNVRFILKRAQVENNIMKQIEILCDPSGTRNKAEMVHTLLDEKGIDLSVKGNTSRIKVFCFDDSKSELERIQNYDVGSASIQFECVQVDRPGKHIVNGVRVHRTYNDCKEQQRHLPGIFNQRKPLQELIATTQDTWFGLNFHMENYNADMIHHDSSSEE